MQPCKFFAQGCCRFGSSCRYLHASPVPYGYVDGGEGRHRTQSSSSLPSEPDGVPGFSSDELAELESAIAQEHAKAVFSTKEIQELEQSIDPYDLDEDDYEDNDEVGYNYGRPEPNPQFVEYYPTGAPRPARVQDNWAGRPSFREVVGGFQGMPNSSDNKFVALQEVLCRFHIDNQCRYGERCRYIHGVRCPHCSKNCLWPDGRPQNNQHVAQCQADKRSGRPDCGICLEPVKTRYGLLSSCDHAFCLECVRSWRGTDGQARDALRACPLCRTVSFFVVPSERWVTDAAEKVAIMESYKENMRKIPCKYFDAGHSTCPFGTSCFYAHLNPDGTPAPVEPPRKCLTSDESVDILQPVRLSDFIEATGHV